MLVSEWEGLKFPDEFVIRFFFKNKLDLQQGKVLELGCSSGHNLSLFYQYGWDVTGVDIEKNAIKMAENNFERSRKSYGLSNPYRFHAQDMVKFVDAYPGTKFDVLLLANSIYYLNYPEILELMAQIKKKNVIAKGSLIFVRVRSTRDYRYGKGEAIGPKSFRLTIQETGEFGCIQTFLSQEDIAGILGENFEFEYQYFFSCEEKNLENGVIISPNSDIIVWGKIK